MCQLSTLESQTRTTDAAANTPRETTWIGGLSRYALLVLSLMVLILSLLALLSCQFWSMDVVASSTLNDITPWIDSDNNQTTTRTAVALGFFGYNPDGMGCHRYNNEYDDNNANDNTYNPESNQGFVIGRSMAIVAATVAMLACCSISIETFCCRYSGSRYLSMTFLLLTLITQSISVVTIYTSSMCYNSSTTTTATSSSSSCTMERGTIFAIIAIALSFIGCIVACTAPKHLPLIQVLMEVERCSDIDPTLCCCCFRCCCWPTSHRQYLQPPKKWSDFFTISMGPPPIVPPQPQQPTPDGAMDEDNDCGSGGDSSSDEEDVFVDVDHDFVGHEIVVTIEPVPSEAAPPVAATTSLPVVISRKPVAPILYPLKEPRKKQSVGADEKSNAKRKYQNGVVVDNELFFDTVTE